MCLLRYRDIHENDYAAFTLKVTTVSCSDLCVYQYVCVDYVFIKLWGPNVSRNVIHFSGPHDDL